MTRPNRAHHKLSAKPEPHPLKPFVDLSKLRKASLKRYKKHFNLDVRADSKTELIEAVGRHFAQMPVREADVAAEFYNFIRGVRQKRTPQQSQTQPSTNAAPNPSTGPSQQQQQQPDSVDDSTLAQQPNEPPSSVPNHQQHSQPLQSHAPKEQQTQQGGSEANGLAVANGNGVAGMSRSPTPSNGVAVSPPLQSNAPTGSMHGVTNTNGPAPGVSAQSRRSNNNSTLVSQAQPPTPATLATGSGAPNATVANANGTTTQSHTLSTRITATASASGR